MSASAPIAVERGGWGAFFLSLFFPGAGQVSAGRVTVGVLFFAFLTFVPVSSTLLCLVFPPWIVTNLALAVLWYVCRLAFAWHALLAKVGPRRPSTVALVAFIAGSVVVLYGVNLAVRVYFIEPYQLPSQSMAPGLIAGDQIFVFKAGPNSRVERGTVVVYRHQGLDQIKRVIGLPGERVEIREGQVSIDGQPLARRPCARAEVEWNDGGHVYRSPCVLESSGAIAWETLAQPFPGGDGEWTVPPDAYFVLGDNRAYSKDSRFDGAVPTVEVRGRVEGVWVSLGSAAPWLRPERIGARPYLPAPRE